MLKKILDHTLYIDVGLFGNPSVPSTSEGRLQNANKRLE
jgi:hypothetical protein